MAQAGISCEIIASDVDENIEGPVHEQVEELALRKARDVRQRLAGDDPTIIIAADTLVSLDGQALSKPTCGAEAFAMLRALQGCKHTVHTGVAIIRIGGAGDDVYSFVESADVYFRPLNSYDIGGYLATGETDDKAGAYGIQGRGAVLVERIEGDYFTVVGLPISRLCAKLADMGVDIWQ